VHLACALALRHAGMVSHAVDQLQTALVQDKHCRSSLRVSLGKHCRNL
jgi:hypothetical protein